MTEDMCQPCAPTASDDVDYTGCEEFCTDAESHCGLCKCKGCSICAGHHPEIACTPKDADDKNFQTCQSWCGTWEAEEGGAVPLARVVI